MKWPSQTVWLSQARVNDVVGQSFVEISHYTKQIQRNPSKAEYHAREAKLQEVLKNDVKEPFN